MSNWPRVLTLSSDVEPSLVLLSLRRACSLTHWGALGHQASEGSSMSLDAVDANYALIVECLVVIDHIKGVCTRRIELNCGPICLLALNLVD